MPRRSKYPSFTIRDPRRDEPIQVEVRVDRRLKRTSRWERVADERIVLRVPSWIPREMLPDLVKQIEKAIARQARRAARATDEDLARRAREINRKYFGGQVRWEAIRWVGNMRKTLGSVTLSGSTRGHIRISDKIRTWPQWVIDYVIAHELAHLLLPEEGHSRRFWETLQQAYPLTERARGFIQGYFFAREGSKANDMEESL